METGIVERISKWTNSKGYFFSVAGKKYSSFGQPSVRIGDKISFSPTERTVAGQTEAHIAFHPPEIPMPEHKPIIHDDKPIVTRLSCISSAVEFCKGKDRLPEDVVKTAKVFEKYAREG